MVEIFVAYKVDCEIEKCGECKRITQVALDALYICNIFDQVLIRASKGNFYRLPDCLTGEKAAQSLQRIESFLFYQNKKLKENEGKVYEDNEEVVPGMTRKEVIAAARASEEEFKKYGGFDI